MVMQLKANVFDDEIDSVAPAIEEDQEVEVGEREESDESNPER